MPFGMYRVHCSRLVALSLSYMSLGVWRTSSGSMCICSYASDISIFDQYLALMTNSWISLISGMGVTSSIVFELRFLTSITVLSEPSVFQMHSSRHACLLDAGNHHPAFT